MRGLEYLTDDDDETPQQKVERIQHRQKGSWEEQEKKILQKKHNKDKKPDRDSIRRNVE